jgi:hypothetical protein
MTTYTKKLLLVSMLLFVLLSLPLIGSVEASSVMWSRTYGGPGNEEAYALVETSDGGFAIVGQTTSFGASKMSIWLIKVDASGNMEWDQTYGGRGLELVSSLIATPDGGYAIAGTTESFGAGRLDFWLIKTDEFGDIEWQNTYGGPLTDQAHRLIATSDGGYAIAGSTESFGAGKKDFWLVKTDASGDMEWSKTYGGADNDAAYALVTTSDGGYAIAGYTHTFDAGRLDFWLVKTDAFGNMEWNHTYGGEGREFAKALVETSDGGYAVAGWTGLGGFTAVYDFYLVKTDASGNMEWQQNYGGRGMEQASSLVETFDGGFAMAGFTTSFGAINTDFWLVKTDKFGHVEWNQTYGGIFWDEANALVETSDGGFAIAGGINSWTPAIDDEFWLVRTEACVNTYEFDFDSGYSTYTVSVSSNSTIEDFNFDIYQNLMSFSVSGPTGTTGFCKVIIPEGLLVGDFPVYLNETLLVEGADYTRTYNGTHNIIYITYDHSSHIIEIRGIFVIPEYCSWLLPTTLLVGILVVVICKKKLLNQP